MSGGGADWTREPPTAEGWFWVRDETFSEWDEQLDTIWVWEDDDGCLDSIYQGEQQWGFPKKPLLYGPRIDTAPAAGAGEESNG